MRILRYQICLTYLDNLMEYNKAKKQHHAKLPNKPANMVITLGL